MELQTINQVSKTYGISARMLRYYEQIGLIDSRRKEDYAYRVYDETALRRLQQIIILRKLRVSVKQIGVILSEPKAAEAIEIFKQNISELDNEINALSVIKNILNRLATELQKQTHIRLEIDALMDSSVLSIVNSLSLSKNYIKESATVDELKKADEKLSKLTDKDVRIVYLPPATVASAYAKGTEPGPELITADIVDKFILCANLKVKYPASRHYGFNNPDEPVYGEGHGYERYITIPDDMEVPSPIVKKHFVGGLYAARTIPMGAWDEWFALHEWVGNSERYEFRWETIDGVCRWIEEHLNYWDWNSSNDDYRQIDLMIPVKIKEIK